MPNNQIFRTHYSYALAVCARLKAFRTDSDLKASDVAEHLNIPTALYVLYEKYELVPHQVIAPLCGLLNMSPWYYLTGTSDDLSPPILSNK